MLEELKDYRDPALCLDLAGKIRDISAEPFNIMEVCGGHTYAIRKNGIHKITGENINFMSGPGCPVCVTPTADIDKAVELASVKGAVVCSFGDLIHVPGSEKSLAEARAGSGNVRAVYSVYDVLGFARAEPGKNFIFISVGFETTAPAAAAAVIRADEDGLGNFFVLALNKTMPAALKAVLGDARSKVHALLCPGHVSTITGSLIYRSLVDETGVSCCITGFEPFDILRAVFELALAREKGEARLINAYERAVNDDGNRKARSVMSEVFEESDSVWRGLGAIPGSGLRLKEKYERFDAEKNFPLETRPAEENAGCICGSILRGISKPPDCPLFRTVCSPDNPAGACMVSSEGACGAWYKYGE
ncbi:MAG: hydrogenase formation protein HypD [Candidatus Omnitrophota bacterium]